MRPILETGKFISTTHQSIATVSIPQPDIFLIVDKIREKTLRTKRAARRYLARRGFDLPYVFDNPVVRSLFFSVLPFRKEVTQ